MKKLSTYLVVMFMIMYWIFRVIVVLMAQLGKEFIVAPLNMNFEIIILFAFLICAILVVKRKVLGAALYLGIYGVYFGADITEKVKILANNEVLTLSQMSSLFFSIIGIIINVMHNIIAGRRRIKQNNLSCVPLLCMLNFFLVPDILLYPPPG